MLNDSAKRNTKFLLILTCFVLIVATGCDKIPFLSKYFPAQKKEEKQVVVETKEPITGDVLARVNDWTLTANEFNEKLDGLKEAIPDYNIDDLDSKKLVLEELVRQELLVQDAEQRGIANEKDIAESVKEFRKTLLVREVASRITGNITVDDAEAEIYYNENKDLFADDTQWQIREIVVPSQAEANEILIELLKGADFATMATQRSKSASAPKGGDMGMVDKFLFPQMESAVATLDKGALSSVFKGPEGYYIAKLEDKKGGTPKEFSEVKEEIKTGLTLLKQQQEILKYIEKLKEGAKIEIHEELLR